MLPGLEVAVRIGVQGAAFRACVTGCCGCFSRLVLCPEHVCRVHMHELFVPGAQQAVFIYFAFTHVDPNTRSGRLFGEQMTGLSPKGAGCELGSITMVIHHVVATAEGDFCDSPQCKKMA